MRAIIHLLRSEDGPAAVEYAVMIGMILMTCFAAIASFGGAAGGSFSDSLNQIGNAMGNANNGTP